MVRQQARDFKGCPNANTAWCSAIDPTMVAQSEPITQLEYTQSPDKAH